MSTVDAAIIEYIVNNNSAGSSSIPTEDVYTKINEINSISAYINGNNEATIYINFREGIYPQTGDLVKLLIDGQVQSYLFIRQSSKSQNEAILVHTEKYQILTAKITNSYGYYGFDITIYPGVYSNINPDDYTLENENIGVYRNTQMSFNTVVKILTHYHAQIPNK